VKFRKLHLTQRTERNRAAINNIATPIVLFMMMNDAAIVIHSPILRRLRGKYTPSDPSTKSCIFLPRIENFANGVAFVGWHGHYLFSLRLSLSE